MQRFYHYKKLMICFSFLFLFFLQIKIVSADSIQASITADQVNFRSEPRTGSTSYGYLYKGTTVTLVSNYSIKGNGCDAGWYNIYFNNKNGYVCGAYINIPGVATYDRPWTSPKKSIVGGAKYISNDYISKGQNTSYLKKFNVNPNAYYNVYTHQYMANLAAPTSEASTSYKTYKENGLLDLPLVFVIPIFNNMPYQTKHPTAELQDQGQWNVTDQEFEKKLDAEGFPDTYKVKLRLLHNQHPNWVFKSLKTNLDFWNTVYVEQNVSSINGCSACYQKPLESTEPGWYIANEDTVSYYVDPRNFLREERILMFEDLSYREEYNATVVSGILKGTFMDGLSAIDNQTYASIFVDAGKEANMSPVYLASLARQESGTRVTNTTNGAKFTYKGITYEGFYNFFNIGAFSSESNPALAGLVWASKGSIPNSDGVYVGGNSTEKPDNGGSDSKPVFNVSQVVNQMNVKQSGNFIINLSVGATVGNLRNKTADGNVTFKRENGQTLADWEKLGTGNQVVYKDGTVHTIVVYGDLTGDGTINSADLLKMRQYLLGQAHLSGAYLESAKVSHGAKVNSADLLRLRQHLLGTTYITQA